ncbi:MAG: TniB family NTP-binding protein [Steroidobacteraceae bacterium]
MSADYPHLHSATRPFAEESSELRIRRIRTDRWITYGRAEAALCAMQDLLTFPKRTRMPNLLLFGPTNNGKTAALLCGKCEGVTELERLGRLTWKEVVALADVLLGMVWTDLTSVERQSLFLRYEYEFLEEPREETGFYAGRHDSLRFLAWLIEGWPDSEGAAVGRGLLKRWLSGKRNRISHHLRPTWPDHPWSPGPHDIEPNIQHRLRELVQ